MKKLMENWRSYLHEERQKPTFKELMDDLEGTSGRVNKVGITSPDYPKLDTQITDNRHEKFREEIDSYDFVEVSGKYGDKWEDSYVIFGIPRNEMVQLAEKFGQEVPIWGKRVKEDDIKYEWIEWNDGEWEVLYKSNGVRYDEEVQNKGDNFSMYHGRKFLIDFF